MVDVYNMKRLAVVAAMACNGQALAMKERLHPA
jgi:hypothetical protein